MTFGVVEVCKNRYKKSGGDDSCLRGVGQCGSHGEDILWVTGASPIKIGHS